MPKLPLNISISPDKHSLVNEKGERWFYLADTWWYGMTSRMPIAIFEQLSALRSKQGFNAIQVIVGIPPETKDYDYSKSPRYFDEVKEKLEILWEHDLVPVIFGGWGQHIETLGEQKIKELWSKIIDLTKGRPAIFSLCGEVDLFPYRVRFFKGLLLKSRLKKWDKIARYIKELDNEHLLTVHIQTQTAARLLFKNPDWLDINSIQSGHSHDRLQFMINMLTQEAKETKPVINLEPWYEGILGDFGVNDQIKAFEVSVESGAAGHGYGAHGIWQMADGDNFMGHWGESDWKKAIKFKGAEEIGKLAKKLVKSTP